jgi:hypothetical protein
MELLISPVSSFKTLCFQLYPGAVERQWWLSAKWDLEIPNPLYFLKKITTPSHDFRSSRSCCVLTDKSWHPRVTDVPFQPRTLYYPTYSTDSWYIRAELFGRLHASDIWYKSWYTWKWLENVKAYGTHIRLVRVPKIKGLRAAAHFIHGIERSSLYLVFSKI